VTPREVTHESRALVHRAFELARALGIESVLVNADHLSSTRFIDELRESERIIWITQVQSGSLRASSTRDTVVRIPSAELSRLSQINVGLFLSVLERHLAPAESVVCLSGAVGGAGLDTLMIANPERRFHWFREDNGEASIVSRELGRAVHIGLRFAAEGREGRPVGTVFVLGDPDELTPYLRQLILNPCEGHPRERRNIHDPAFLETLRELAALDGAFVVDPTGSVDSAGTYIDAPIEAAELLPGFGARHAAAAAITAAARATAVVISESSGMVTVFRKGRSVLKLEKPGSGP
jgi:DNA integrity scanning protein DisA with diadenylate cyclase activity